MIKGMKFQMRERNVLNASSGITFSGFLIHLFANDTVLGGDCARQLVL